MNTYIVFGSAFVIFLFLGILLCLYGGRRYAIWQDTLAKGRKHGGIHITEGAIFALLGLLVAFTFAGALKKFDDRRILIVDEVNALSTAYLRLDLLPESKQSLVKYHLATYINQRVDTYKQLPDIDLAEQYLEKSLATQERVWQEAVLGCREVEASYPCMLILPALNQAFDLANTRVSYTKLHPPLFIFFLLVGIVFVGATLAGYSISSRKLGSSLHIISYAFVIAIVIFAIIDMEYPRLGFIQITTFDRFLVELQEKLPS